MYRNELYKIFTKKSIYVVLILILLTMIYGNRVVEGDITLKGNIYDELYEEWGGPITADNEAKAIESMRASDEGVVKTKTREEYAEAEIHVLIARAALGSKALQERKNDLQLQLEKVEMHSFDNRAMAKELSMLQKLDEPFGFYLIRSWQGMFDLIEPILSVIFFSTLIILGLTPVFADEYTNRTADLILTSRHGRRTIVTIKLFASMTYISIVFTLIHVVNFIIQWVKFGGVNGWNGPMQNLYLWSVVDFNASPFHWDTWQFYVITLGIQWLACVSLGLLVMILSLVLKNTMLTLFTSGAMVAIPTFLAQFAQGKGILSYLGSFNYVEFLKSATLFQEFKTYNIFGNPVLYPVLLIAIFLFITIMVLLLIYRYHQKIEITN